MIVQATVNDAGPFNFLLDTGTTRAVIDPALAQQLSAPVLGEVAVTGALHQRQDKLVMLKQLQLGEASVSSLGAVVDKIAQDRAAKVTRARNSRRPGRGFSLQVRYSHRLSTTLAAL